MANSENEAFEALLDRLSKDEPHVGWLNVRQLPMLSDADLGVVLAHEPGLLCDALADDKVAQTIATFLKAERSAIHTVVDVGSAVVLLLRDEVRGYLLRELRTRIDYETAQGLEQHGCVRGADVGLPATGEL